nr:MAG TPA: hypothetical protein [Caudoviricetes sp.]
MQSSPKKLYYSNLIHCYTVNYIPGCFAALLRAVFSVLSRVFTVYIGYIHFVTFF